MPKLICAVMPDSTVDGWTQDGSPCPCPPCGEMRLKWFETYAIALDRSAGPLINILAVRLPQFIADYRSLQRALVAVRAQVMELERQHQQARPDLNCDAVRERLFKREEFITTLKESLTDLVDEINLLTDEVDQELDHE